MRQFRKFGGIAGYYSWMKTVVSINKYQGDATAKYRLNVLRHYQQYGLSSTLNAFPLSRATLFRWQQKLEQNQGRLASLLPETTRPKQIRRMTINPLLLEEIVRLRHQHWRISKYKLKPLLDEFCEGNNLEKMSVSWIGKLIKRQNLFFQKQGRTYHTPKDKPFAYNPKSRVKRAPKPEDGGYVEADTVETIIEGRRRYTISFIDVRLKIAFSKTYPSKHAKHVLDCFQEFEKHLPLPIHTLQTGNGSEFVGEFSLFLEKNRPHIKHLYTYPHSPKINGVIERYNRTLQEEHLSQYQDTLLWHDLGNQKLCEYLYYYNYQRVHQTLYYQTPMQALLKETKSFICV